MGFTLNAMKDSQDSTGFHRLYDKVQTILCCHNLPNNYKKLDSKLERKMMEIKRNASGNINFKSMDTIIMKFPQLREGLKEIRDIFKQYDEDSNGLMDYEETKKCLYSLEFGIKDEDFDDLFGYCDMDENKGISFKEFIVLLCLVYLIVDSSTSSQAILKMCWPRIEATFKTVIEVFLFLDKNGVGKLKKKDVVKALNEASRRRSPPNTSQGVVLRKWTGIRMEKLASKNSCFLLSVGLGLIQTMKLMRIYRYM